MTKYQLAARYRKTLAGFMWVIINPIVLFIAQCIAFQKILKIDLPQYHLFLLGNLLPWMFLMGCLTMSAPLFEEKRVLLRSFSIHPAVTVASLVLDNFLNFAAAFFILFLAIGIFTPMNWMNLLLLPFAFLPLIVGAFCISFIFATLNMFYRDIKFIIQFVSNLLFFLTPVFYPIEYVPSVFQPLIQLNLFYLLITPVRVCVYDFSFVQFSLTLLEALAGAFVALFLAWRLWHSKRNELYLQL